MRGWTEHRGRNAGAGLDDRPGSLPAPPAEATAAGGWRWLPPLVLLYGASRLATGMMLFAARRPGHPFASAWDATWYLEVARRGYPASLAAAPGADLQRLAFFPLLPLLLRLTGATSGPAALAVALLVGFAATCLVWLLTRTLVGERDGDAAAAHAAAGRAAALFCFFPGALVLSIGGSENFFR